MTVMTIVVLATAFVTIGSQPAKAQAPAASVASPAAQIRTLKITVLSTMLVGEAAGLGE